jgi:DNA-binding response OmpR family regulator
MTGAQANVIKARVLVVDDEEVIADTLALILKHHGFEASAVYSGEAAIRIAMFIRPDLLISDLTMPGVDGIDTAARILALLPNCKVIIHSGIADYPDHLLRTRLEESCLEILPKPYPPQSLLKRIQELCS